MIMSANDPYTKFDANPPMEPAGQMLFATFDMLLTANHY